MTSAEDHEIYLPQGSAGQAKWIAELRVARVNLALAPKKWQNSRFVNLPCPSAMFDATDTAARRS
jgi:hypothetical protein